MGLIVEVVSDDPIIGNRFFLVRWNNGTLDTLNERLLEVVSNGSTWNISSSYKHLTRSG
jgi:hypothetical protein